MAPKIFLTGATGYIGGDALYELYNKHPDYEYAVLVRSEQKGSQVKDAFPNVRIVIGDLDNSKVLEDEAAKADVIRQMRPTTKALRVQSQKALPLAIAKKTLGSGSIQVGLESSVGKTRNMIALANILIKNTMTGGTYQGGVEELTNLPDEAFHRNVDKIVLEAGTKHAASVKTAILCPPTIYGRGRGPSNARSRQAYELAKLILTAQYIPVVGAGKARWNNVHVADLTGVFVLLTEAAVSKDLDPELWGEKGYLLVENGEHLWTEFARKMGQKAEELGLVKGKLEEKGLEKESALKQAGFEAVSWGLNSRGKAERAKRILGWKPSKPSIEEEIEGILRDEKQRLG